MKALAKELRSIRKLLEEERRKALRLADELSLEARRAELEHELEEARPPEPAPAEVPDIDWELIRKMTAPKTPPPPSPRRWPDPRPLNVCVDGGYHDYPQYWMSTVPPACRKCGVSAQGYNDNSGIWTLGSGSSVIAQAVDLKDEGSPILLHYLVPMEQEG